MAPQAISEEESNARQSTLETHSRTVEGSYLQLHSEKEMRLPYARMLNCDFIWVHSSAPVLESTLAHTLNMRGVRTLVVEMGVGMRITRAYGEQLLDGIFHLMHEKGVWLGEDRPVRRPIESTDGQVAFVNAEGRGMFVPRATHWHSVRRGEVIGELINPLEGTGLEVKSPVDGILFTLREYPLVYEGSLLARILEQEAMSR